MDELFSLIGTAEEGFKYRFSSAIDAHIGRDAIEPGVQRGIGLEFRQGLIGLQECVLGRVLRIMSVPKHMPAKVVDPVLVSKQDLFKSGRVSVFETSYEFYLVGILHGYDWNVTILSA